MAFGALGSTTGDEVKGRHGAALWAALKPAEWPAAAWACIKAQERHLLLYVPMFLIAGNWAYFQLSFEPGVEALLVLAALAAALLLAKRGNVALFLVGIVLLGFCATQFRALMVATPMLRGPTNGVIAGGYVADYENKAGGARELIIAVEEATGIPDGEQPKRIRIYAPGTGSLQIGDYITFEAYLSPLPRPVQPGGFDYGRMLYFQSIGAGGRMIGPPAVEERPVPWRYQYRRIFRGLRQAISSRITAVIPGAVGHLADSMVSGERAGIPAEMNTSLQISGLAHIISISGLHMSMVAGGVFWAVRALLAFIPFFALNFPIKKIAAVAALVVGLFYTLLADSGSATERSYLMIAVMFFAVLIDRPAISLRNLAIAAIIILLVTPEESVGASFQMSFLAVMGLSGFAEWQRQRQTHAPPKQMPLAARLRHKAWHFTVVSALTTLVAGGTSTIAAAYHFDRLSPYSVIANGVTLPVSEALVMPPALVAVLLMPLGLEYYPLKVMELGLALTMKVSDWIATWPGSNLMVAKPHVAGIVLMALGAGLVAAGIGRMRQAGLAVALLGLLATQLSSRPAILIEDRAATVAILTPQGRYTFAQGAKNKFVGSKWLQGNGETVSLDEASSGSGWDCTSGDCFSDLAPLSVAYLREKSGQGLYCPPTEIIIADFPLHHQCREARLVIDRIDVWRSGAQAISFAGSRYILKTARAEQGNRPWAYDSRKGIGTKPRAAEPAPAQ
ncbi:MAG: ComEC/Rec2 family competence protein [Alphaproteobacteria bacterium]|nr:ComEC/Rec2 family competence protein [Alphaproteobacteria bacterium]